MAVIIQFPNRPIPKLKEVRKFLGGGFFRKALLEWSIEELKQTINHPESWLMDADLNYTAILRFRLDRLNPRPDAEVITFPERKAA